MSFFKSKNDNELKTKNRISRVLNSRKKEKKGKFQKNKNRKISKKNSKILTSNEKINDNRNERALNNTSNITNIEAEKINSKNNEEKQTEIQKIEMNNKMINEVKNTEKNLNISTIIEKENLSFNNDTNIELTNNNAINNSVCSEKLILIEEKGGVEKPQNIVSFEDIPIDEIKTSSTLINSTVQEETKTTNVSKRNSIFRSFSHLKIRSKTNMHENNRSKSIQEFNNDKTHEIKHKSKSNELNRGNSLSNSSTINNDSELRIKRNMSVPNSKNSLKHTFTFKKKKSHNSVSSINNSPNTVVPIDRNYKSLDLLVKETKFIVRNFDPQTGRKMINNYVIVKEVGRGCHGKVKLCYDINTNEQYAIKIVEKRSKRRFYTRMSMNQKQSELPNPHMEKIKREIAILKKCTHPHVVRLKEVIDSQDSEKIYIVLEYLDGGEVQWQVSQDDPRPVMNQDTARKVFRDIISGVGYLHHQGIVHRDIKPANLLWTSDGNVKISDFGVSCFMTTNNSTLSLKEKRNNELELAKTAGSPAFFAPELCGINDDEIPNTITQFAALLNSRTSSVNRSASKSSFPRTPSNISSYSKLDAIFAPRSQNSLSISHYSEGSNNKLSVTRKSSSNYSQEKHSNDSDTPKKSMSGNTDNNISSFSNSNDKAISFLKSNIPNEVKSYSSLQNEGSITDMNNCLSNKNKMKGNASTYSSANSVLQQGKNLNTKPRSIKWVQTPSKRSLSITEEQYQLSRKINQEGAHEQNKCILSKNSNDTSFEVSRDEIISNLKPKVSDTITINNNPVNGSMTSVNTIKSAKNITKNNIKMRNNSSNDSIDFNIKNKSNNNIDISINLIDSNEDFDKYLNKNSNIFEKKTNTNDLTYSSKANTLLLNRNIKNSNSINEINKTKLNDKKNKSSSSINISSSTIGKSNSFSYSQNEIEKFIPSESPLFIRRRCSHSSTHSNFTNRATSTNSSIYRNQILNNMENDNLNNQLQKNNYSRENLNNKDKFLFSKSDASLSKRINIDRNYSIDKSYLRRSNSSSLVRLNGKSDSKNLNKKEYEEINTKTVTPQIDGKAIDIWAMGVTLYCLIYGNVPFTASTEFELLSVICRKEVEYPKNIKISDSLLDLFKRIFCKDPKKRIKMNEIQKHPWVTEDLTKKEREEWLSFVILNSDPLDVTEEEVKKALTLKEKIKRKISKISHSLNHITGEFRWKTKSLPVVKVNVEENNKEKKRSLSSAKPNSAKEDVFYHYNTSLIGSTQKIIEEEDEFNKKREKSITSDIKEIDDNEDSSGEILYMSFDKKTKK